MVGQFASLLGFVIKPPRDNIGPRKKTMAPVEQRVPESGDKLSQFAGAGDWSFWGGCANIFLLTPKHPCKTGEALTGTFGKSDSRYSSEMNIIMEFSFCYVQFTSVLKTRRGNS